MPDKKEKLKKELESGRVSTESELKVFLMLEDLREELETLKTQVDEAVQEVEKSKLDLPSVLENVRGKDSKPEDVAEILKNDTSFKEELKGEKGDSIKGDDYVLTEKDKKEIAKSIDVPIVEKIIEKTIVEQPIVTNEIKEVAINETAEQVRDKLEGIKEGEKLSIQAIQDLSKMLEEIKGNITNVSSRVGTSLISKRIRFIDDETPSGTVNGSNTIFTISKAPETGSLKVYRGGIRLRVTEDYTFSGKTITFTIPPVTGEILLADFRF